jgi:dienelactone hydrolase
MDDTPGRKSMLGAYGAWAAGELGEGPGRLSLRSAGHRDVDDWRRIARERVSQLIAEPAGAAADVRVENRQTREGLDVELLSWQLPWGPRTSACLLKPAGAAGRLPGVLALHDHGGFKYLGWRKLVRTQLAPLHPMVERHQQACYGGVGWPDELARRGYVVLCHDVFAFGSRRINASDLPDLVVGRLMQAPEQTRELEPEDVGVVGSGEGCDVPPGEPSDRIERYHAFAAQHESIVAKSLFSAGLTWPGVTLAEDRAALAYLASRADVDPARLACGGLSGGGLRTCFLAGMDDRIRAAVTVGFLTTWRDFLLATSHTHTWMIYVPGLPRDLDFPEILGLRAPLASLALATTEDPLFTRSETERAGRMLAEVYRRAGAPQAFRLSWHPGPHQFDRAMQAEAFDWIGTWLA